jgi:hypothetical protein
MQLSIQHLYALCAGIFMISSDVLKIDRLRGAEPWQLLRKDATEVEVEKAEKTCTAVR